MMDKIRTKRLLLRPLRMSDAGDLAALADDWEVVRTLAKLPFPYKLADAYAFIEWIERERPLEWGVFTDRLIGCVGVTRHLGYWYGRAHWGKGYATEAATAALDAYFAETDAAIIVSGAFDENVMSQRVLAKLGFVETGRSMKYSEARHAPVDHIDMLLERTTWVARRTQS